MHSCLQPTYIKGDEALKNAKQDKMKMHQKPMWKEENNKLVCDFEFKNFSEAFAFMTRIALIAEKMNHHPDWSNSWNKVHISLSTHSEGNIVTEKDRRLASEIDKLLEQENY